MAGGRRVAARHRPLWGGVSLACACLLPLAGDGPTPLGHALQIDLEADGRVELVRFEPLAEETVTVSRDGVALWRGVSRELSPWKLAVADVDGDGTRELALGVHVATPYVRFPHNCLRVLGWTGSSAQPKWLGSRLSHPFDGFTFAELDGTPGEELIATETDTNGSRRIAVYHWVGFGFEGSLLPGRWRELRLVSSGRDTVALEADGERLVLRGAVR